MTTADLKKKRNGIQREAKRLSREVRGHEEQIAEKMILMDNMAGDLEKASAEYSKLEDEGKYFKRKRACIAYMESTVDISIPPPSFQTCFIVFVTYLLDSKTPKQVFFNPINIFDSFIYSITV